jgi:hypothetical protein
VNVPVCDGTPLNTPFGASVKPGGRFPVATNWASGGTADKPCVMFAEYGTPTTASGSVTLEDCGLTSTVPEPVRVKVKPDATVPGGTVKANAKDPVAPASDPVPPVTVISPVSMSEAYETGVLDADRVPPELRVMTREALSEFGPLPLLVKTAVAAPNGASVPEPVALALFGRPLPLPEKFRLMDVEPAPKLRTLKNRPKQTPVPTRVGDTRLIVMILHLGARSLTAQVAVIVAIEEFYAI